MIEVAEATHNKVIDFEKVGYGLKVFGSFRL